MNDYQKSIKTIVIESKDDYVVLKDSIFHQEGGGQPSDKGFIENQEIIKCDCKKFYLKNNIFKKNQEVTLFIDWDYRYSLMKAHTAEHLLFGSLKKLNPSLEVEKIQLSINESKIFFKGTISLNDIIQAQILANEKIKEGLEITEKFVKKEEVFGARIKIDRIKDDNIRIISIGDYDSAACSGTHLKSTKEIGLIIVTGLKKESSIITQLSFLTGSKAVEHSIKASALMNELSSEFNEVPEKLKQRLSVLIDENKALKADLRNLSDEFLKSANFTKINGILFYDSRYIETDKLIKKAYEESEQSNLVFLSNSTIIVAGKNSNDIFCRLKEEFEIKGGGREVKIGKIKNANAKNIKIKLSRLNY
ncbi:MAG: alanyl-tRNA editing protein [Candidatus Nanoarchaeia archaeon]|jgi:alanyl-tRNA synthetase